MSRRLAPHGFAVRSKCRTACAIKRPESIIAAREECFSLLRWAARMKRPGVIQTLEVPERGFEKVEEITIFSKLVENGTLDIFLM